LKEGIAMFKKFIPLALTALLANPAFAGSVTVKAVDRNGAPLPFAVVSLTPGAKPAPVTGKSATVEQRNFKFEPFVSIVPRGTKMSFPNRDGADHHVKSLSGPTTFSFKLASAKDKPEVVSFDNAGRVTVHCLVHSYMVGHIYVVDTPYAGITDAQGLLEIRDVPNGEYELMVDHPNVLASAMIKPAPPAKVTMTSSGPIELSYAFDFVYKPRR
jgi:plastocyanin